ncbi:uncharacterized protein LOC135929425 isoform X2 [Gordionus sp. m RMFG-2023]|uniref:uncharacterized protein LOC135929425 isoform X2 n=1 Tax=Gordionus sp. m RMFG-2023 TaxID=3053472 RepID=UPI0031FBD474
MSTMILYKLDKSELFKNITIFSFIEGRLLALFQLNNNSLVLKELVEFDKLFFLDWQCQIFQFNHSLETYNGLTKILFLDRNEEFSLTLDFIPIEKDLTMIADASDVELFQYYFDEETKTITNNGLIKHSFVIKLFCKKDYFLHPQIYHSLYTKSNLTSLLNQKDTEMPISVNMRFYPLSQTLQSCNIRTYKILNIWVGCPPLSRIFIYSDYKISFDNIVLESNHFNFNATEILHVQDTMYFNSKRLIDPENSFTVAFAENFTPIMAIYSPLQYPQQTPKNVSDAKYIIVPLDVQKENYLTNFASDIIYNKESITKTINCKKIEYKNLLNYDEIKDTDTYIHCSHSHSQGSIDEPLYLNSNYTVTNLNGYLVQFPILRWTDISHINQKFTFYVQIMDETVTFCDDLFGFIGIFISESSVGDINSTKDLPINTKSLNTNVFRAWLQDNMMTLSRRDQKELLDSSDYRLEGIH